ncbi:hypothetical protein [Nocardioides terrigena]|uniref:hypothetical protein n=1 Tax=Nocardioides terrigena TaxID=424797 RepID=UPI000D31B42D|nr:hypothetical protein [Nocardioides terrigena]
MDTPGTDSTGTNGDWNDPDASDADGSPASSFPGAGERVDDSAAALDAEPAGNATVGDMVDTDAVDSSAHEVGPGSDEVAEQAAEESVEDDD